MRVAGDHDRLHDVGTDVADRAEPEADVGTHGGEHGVGLVHVGRQHLDAHPSAFGQVDRGLVLLVLHRLQQCRHVLGRVVGLEPGGLIADQAVGSRV